MIAMPSPDASRLVLHSEVAELDRLAAWIESFAQHSALSADISFTVALCLEKAVANVYKRRNGRNRLTLRFLESEATSKQPG
jgi:hypothetical protein